MSLKKRRHKKEIGTRDMGPVVERISQAALLMEKARELKAEAKRLEKTAKELLRELESEKVLVSRIFRYFLSIYSLFRFRHLTN